MLKDRKIRGVVQALLVSNAVSVVLFGIRIVGAQNFDYWFLFWNLFLAWLPVLFAWLLVKSLQKRAWAEPLPVLLTLLWLGFLPNSFYIITDLIHLQSTGDIGVLYDVVFMMSFIWNGLIAGMLSMLLVHGQLIKRRSSSLAALVMTSVIALVSFAIYLGRSLRWNTWDVIANPAGLLFDVSERVINPLDHPQSVTTTATFFLLIGSMYYVVWTLVQALSSVSEPKAKSLTKKH